MLEQPRQPAALGASGSVCPSHWVTGRVYSCRWAQGCSHVDVHFSKWDRALTVYKTIGLCTLGTLPPSDEATSSGENLPRTGTENLGNCILPRPWGWGRGACGLGPRLVKIHGLQIILYQVTVASALAVPDMAPQHWHPLEAGWNCSLSGSIPDPLNQSAFNTVPRGLMGPLRLSSTGSTVML